MIPTTILERVMSFLGKRPDYRGLRGVGQRWERLARRRLEADGYEILEANFRTRGGEIDFIAREKGVLCFVEVKGRSGPAFGSPGEAVTSEKQRRIVRVAEQYLARERVRPECRFDVVSIVDRGEDGGDAQ